MGYGTDGLTFNTLRRANQARLPEFRNTKGQFAHSKPDGSDWSLNDWMVAVTGEVGETANKLKKLRRGDFSLEEIRADLASEFADMVTYLDILAFQCGINLGQAVMDKFNQKSKEVGSRVWIDAEDWHLLPAKE